MKTGKKTRAEIPEDAVFFRFPMQHGEITACARYSESLRDYRDGIVVTAPGWQIGLAFCSKEDYGMSRKVRRQIGRNLASKKNNFVIRCGDIRAGLLRVKVMEHIVFEAPRHLGVFHYGGASAKCRFKQFMNLTIPALREQLEAYDALEQEGVCGVGGCPGGSRG